MKLKLGEQNALVLCQYTSFAEVANGLFGGKKTDEKREDITAGKTYDTAIASINSFMTLG